MAKNKHEKKSEELRREGKPRPKESWFPSDQQKRTTADEKIGWDRENSRREKKAQK